MYGKYKHTVDAKGRLFVPSKLRTKLGSAFFVLKNAKGYLTVFPEDVWEQKIDKLKEQPTGKVAGMRYILSNAIRCEVDKQGRFLLPEDYRQCADLTQEVMIIGQANCAEIWNVERYEEDEAKFFADPEQSEAIMEALGF